jgi:hypothetical protein
VDDYKWRQLEGLARAEAALAPLLLRCRSSYERGLLEWRLAVEAALRATDDLPSHQHLAVRYEDLLDDPVTTIRGIEDFLGLEHHPATSAHAQRNIARRSTPAEALSVTDDTAVIAGPLLARLGYSRPARSRS